MRLSRSEKLNIVKRLNWDYRAEAKDLLDVIEGRSPIAGSFDQRKLFLRSLERLPWHYVVALWGTEKMDELYTEELRGMIWRKEKRETYDASFAILRGDYLPGAGWDSERMHRYQNTFLSDRWNRT
jgi:hypothetical protein